MATVFGFVYIHVYMYIYIYSSNTADLHVVYVAYFFEPLNPGVLAFLILRSSTLSRGALDAGSTLTP